jgi:hypothetical protein
MSGWPVNPSSSVAVTGHVKVLYFQGFKNGSHRKVVARLSSRLREYELT